MTDWEEHIASLPDPFKDEKPPSVGFLTKEEQEAIRQQKKSRVKTRQYWSNPAEAMVGRVLRAAFNAKNTVRSVDRMQEVPLKDGGTRRFYANSGIPDWSFAICDGGEWKDGVCEVKCCSPSSSGIDLHAANTIGQIQYMDKHPEKFRMWGLVFWEERGKARVFIVRHLALKYVMQVTLPDIAKEDGRFRGQSIRRKKDLWMFEDCEVVKQGNQWALPLGHWYAG